MTLTVYKDDKALILSTEIKTIDGARAHHGMLCPKCGSTQGQGMDGWIGAECRLYFNCPTCGFYSVVTAYYPDNFQWEGAQIQRDFAPKAYKEMCKELIYNKQNQQSIEYKKSKDLTNSIVEVLPKEKAKLKKRKGNKRKLLSLFKNK
jgi:hypothetical protein